MTRRLQKPGFTLVELLAYMGMSAIVLVVVSTLMVNLSASAARERVAHDLSTSGQLIMNRLMYGVRTATGAPVVTGANLEIPTSTGTLTYALQGTDVTETLPDGTSATLNTSTVAVDSLLFTDDGVGISIALSLAPAATTTPAVPAKEFSATLVPRFTLYD